MRLADTSQALQRAQAIRRVALTVRVVYSQLKIDQGEERGCVSGRPSAS